MNYFTKMPFGENDNRFGIFLVNMGTTIHFLRIYAPESEVNIAGSRLVQKGRNARNSVG